MSASPGLFWFSCWVGGHKRPNAGYRTGNNLLGRLPRQVRGGRIMKITASYQEMLMKRLKKDEAFREAYLNEALEDEDRRLILLALRNVAQATGGLSRLSKTTGLNRQHLYRTLSKG